MEQAPLALDAYLDGVAPSLLQGDALADVVSRLAKAAVELADLIAAGPFAGIEGRQSGTNSGGDTQIDLDIAANTLMCSALRDAPVLVVASGVDSTWGDGRAGRGRTGTCGGSVALQRRRSSLRL